MTERQALHELARRARVERSLYIAEGIADFIVTTIQLVKDLAKRPEHFPPKPVRRVPAHQR